ncbi:MAG: PAS domain S-box protein [Agitococcus sp.]|nr:PAS domain S-box protein [Agitococcus sp.]
MKLLHKTMISLIGAILLIVIGLIVLFSFFGQIEKEADYRRQQQRVIHDANALMSALTDAETSERGYLLTGDETFLQPYLAVHGEINGRINILRRYSTHRTANEKLDLLAPLIAAKLVDMADVIELRRHGDMTVAEASVRSGQGKQLMDDIRLQMNHFVAIEETLLKQSETKFSSDMRRLFIIILTTSLFALLLSFLYLYLVYLQNQQQLKNAIHTETQRLLAVQEEANQQLRKANEAWALQRAIFESAYFSSIATDEKGVIQIFNVGAERMLGYAAADVVNQITPADISDPQEVISRAEALSAELSTAIQPGFEALAFKASRGIEDIYELTYIRKDGGRFPAIVSVTALRAADNHIIGYMLISTDNTARKQVEEEQKKLDQRLRDQQFYTRSLIESNIDALMTTDPSGIITDVNKQMEALTECSRDELIGAPFKSFFTSPELAEKAIKQVLSEKKVTDYELTVCARDGKKTVVSYNATTFFDRDRKLQGVFAAARDVTERKRLDDVLHEKNIELQNAKSIAEKANLAKSDFLSSMSHELRTPLNAILGFTQLMDGGSPPPTATQKRSIDQILKAGWYLLELINEILDLALIESGKLSLSMEPVSLAEVMHECWLMVEPQTTKRGIQVTFPQFITPHFVQADRTRLKQVLINLLSNAIKYNRDGGRVTVSSHINHLDHVRVSVEDTGDGLSAEKISQLFQPFNRLGQEAYNEEGTGIGLVVCKQLVELMGGIVGVNSIVGVGSVFWFELSLTRQPQLNLSAAETVAEATPATQDDTLLYTLLYVEDNPANLMLVEDIIARRPEIRLLSAMDGISGIKIAHTMQPDIVLMDINLPGMSGLRALQILAESSATAHIPVIALSANAMPRDIEKGLEAGFFRYLTKPIKVNEFMTTLDIALKQAKITTPSIPVATSEEKT